MIDNNLTTLLNELPKETLDAIRKYVAYKDDKLLPLFDLLHKFHLNYNSKTYTPQRIKRAMAKGSKMPTKNTMSQYFSDLKEYVIEYLYVSYYKRGEYASQRNILEKLKSFARPEFFQDLSNKLIRQIEKKPTSRASLQKLIELEKGIYYHPNIDTNQGYPNLISKLFIHVEQYALIEHLWNISELLSRKSILNVDDIQIDSKEKIIILQDKDGNNESILHLSEYLEKANSFKDPVFKLYHAIIELQLNEQNGPKFKDIIQYFLNEYNNLGAVDRRVFNTKLTNYCNREIENGNGEYFEECYNLYMFAYKKQILVYHNNINPNTLLNFSIMAASHKEFKLAKQLITDYAPLINHDAYSKYVENLAKGYISFFEGNFFRAIEFLAEIVKKNYSFIKIRVRQFSFQVAFELLLLEQKREFLPKAEEYEKIREALFVKKASTTKNKGKDNIMLDTYDLIKNAIDSQKSSIPNQKGISPRKKEAFLNTVSFIRLLLLKTGQAVVSKKEKEILSAELESLNPIISKDWLLEKIDVL